MEVYVFNLDMLALFDYLIANDKMLLLRYCHHLATNVLPHASAKVYSFVDPKNPTGRLPAYVYLKTYLVNLTTAVP